MLTFDEDTRGSITPGKLADLTVLDRDPLTVADDTLKDLRSELTLVGGRTVWQRLAQRQNSAATDAPMA